MSNLKFQQGAETTNLFVGPITGFHILISPKRAHRPNAFLTDKQSSSSSGSCPFCPGNETETPPATYTLADEKGRWLLRVVPNKYPIVEPLPHPASQNSEPVAEGRVSGIHEVLIESPEHDQPIHDLPVDHLVHIWRAVLSRFESYKQNPTLKVAIYFRNEGSWAGASMEHPHAQLLGLSFLPPQLKHELDSTASYYRLTRRCYFCDLLRRSKQNDKLLVTQSENFTALVPPEARFPYEVWILPIRHAARPGANLPTQVLMSLASTLLSLLQSLEELFHQPAYNLYLLQAPLQDLTDLQHYHWRLVVVPRLTHLAGFELATGTYVNPVTSEQAAARLRAARRSASLKTGRRS